MEYTLSPAHVAYEATAEFKAYWTAYLEAARLHNVWLQSSSTADYKAWVAACSVSMAALVILRETPEHKTLFGW
jgi:hypothetical protein